MKGELSISREGVKALSEVKNEPEWVAERRAESWKVFSDLPMPTLKDELWKYTDISSADLNTFKPGVDSAFGRVDRLAEFSSEALSLLSDEAVHLEEEGGRCKPGLVIQHDSEVTFTDLDPALEERGVVFCSMEKAVADYPELVRKYFTGKRSQASEHKFNALSGAFWSGGIFLYVPDGIELTIPLKSYHLLTGGGEAVFGHSIIILEPGSRVTYIEQMRSEDHATDSLCSAVTDILVKDGASFTYITLQNWGENVIDVSTRRAVVKRDASMNWVVGNIGGKLTKSFFETKLTEPGADTKTRGFSVSSGTQHQDIYTLMSHQAPDTSGNILYKSVLNGKSRTVFRGLINIDPDARQTNSYLTNNNLLLSDTARADSVPTLEINANDVKASHGATVGHLDEQQVFYLMSRGLPRKSAERLIISGFFGTIIDTLGSEILRERMYEFINAKLEVQNG